MSYKLLFKDAEPADTITRIKKILSNNGIAVTENMMEGFDGVFSASVIIDGLGLGHNGKGLSREAALASAYAELMERIQNFGLYKFLFPVKDEIDSAKFYYAPDEKAITYNEYMQRITLFKTAIDTNSISVNDLVMINTKYEINSNIVLCVPYIDYSNNESVYIPARLCEHVYASNGMAAGNTYTEALVQSICEIFERYANRVIYEGKLIPPDIRSEDIPFSTEIINIVSKLTQRGNYIIKFKDCSLGIGLPVVGMYFIDKATGKYFVKFGSHPVLSVAAERTITELFQGRSLSRSSFWLNAFTFGTNIDTDVVFENIFRSGDGSYPYTIFSEASSYAYYNCWCKADGVNNEALLNYLLNIIKQNNWGLFHRDVSFLGFPSLHVFIPEISNITQVNKHYLEKQIWYKRIKKFMKTLNQCNQKELVEIVDFIDSNYYSEFDTIRRLTGLPLRGNSSFNNTNNLFFKYLICCKTAEYDRGVKELNRFLKESFLSFEELAFYRCLREATIALYVMKMEQSEVITILNTVFSSDLVTRVMATILNNRFETFNCFDCNYCLSKNACYYPQIIAFDNHISEKYISWKNR
ncbi:MAG: YcaO-like family protein [Dehalococcoidia bacterium]|nr:YcaO-like family protein [Dehalococcoidia bacterium]